MALSPVYAQTYRAPSRSPSIANGVLAGPAAITQKQAAQRKQQWQHIPGVAPTRPTSSSIHTQQASQPCWDAAARYQNVPGLNPWLLYAVAYVESHHNPNAINRNNNGSYDLGLMQINSIWFPTLRKYGISTKLLRNACASTFVGAWVLAQTIHKYGYTWKAIAAYNVGSLNTERRRKIGYRYAQKVYEAYRYLLKRNHVPLPSGHGTLPVSSARPHAARPPVGQVVGHRVARTVYPQSTLTVGNSTVSSSRVPSVSYAVRPEAKTRR